MIEDEVYTAANGLQFKAAGGERFHIRDLSRPAFSPVCWERCDWSEDEDQATRDWLESQWARIAKRDRVQTPAPSSSNGQDPQGLYQPIDQQGPAKRAAVAYSNPAKDAHASIVWGLFRLEIDGEEALTGDNLDYLRDLGQMILAAVDDYEQQEKAEK